MYFCALLLVCIYADDVIRVCVCVATDLIEGKGIGIFALLDEESKLPRPTFDHFTDEVHKRNKNHYRITVRGGSSEETGRRGLLTTLTL